MNQPQNLSSSQVTSPKSIVTAVYQPQKYCHYSEPAPKVLSALFTSPENIITMMYLYCCHYFQISLCVKSFKLQVPAEERESSSAGLKRWQGVASMSEENPSVVMEFLLSAQQFDLASEWAHLHNLPPKFHKAS